MDLSTQRAGRPGVLVDKGQGGPKVGAGPSVQQEPWMGCAAAGRGQRWRVRPCSRGWAAQRQRDGAAALGRPAVVGWRSCRRHAVRARCGQDSRWFVGPAGVMVGPCGSVDESGHCGREWAIVDESGPLWTLACAFMQLQPHNCPGSSTCMGACMGVRTGLVASTPNHSLAPCPDP